MDEKESGWAAEEEEGSEEASEGESGDDSSSEASVQALAPNRSRRRNAGARMASLLNDAELVRTDTGGDGDFYAEAYGGFAEEADDAEFADDDASESGSDEVDSDFDIDETEADAEEAGEESEEPRKRQRGIVTKAYKEPAEKRPPRKAPAKPRERVEVAASSRELRHHHDSAAGSAMRPKPALRKAKPKHRSQRVQRRLSQAEMLKEAAVTERANLASLNRYQELEETAAKLRRAKSRKKSALPGPRILHVSTAERSLLVYTSATASFPPPSALPTKVPRAPRRCVVTGLPARYIDPFTELPYHNASAFNTIRKTYNDFIKTHGE